MRVSDDGKKIVAYSEETTGSPRHDLSITDLHMAGTLLCLGHMLKSVHDHHAYNNKKVFQFYWDDSIDMHITCYWNGTLLVEPKKHASSIKEAKNYLYAPPTYGSTRY